jgi:hypothetical protein
MRPAGPPFSQSVVWLRPSYRLWKPNRGPSKKGDVSETRFCHLFSQRRRLFLGHGKKFGFPASRFCRPCLRSPGVAPPSLKQILWWNSAFQPRTSRWLGTVNAGIIAGRFRFGPFKSLRGLCRNRTDNCAGLLKGDTKGVSRTLNPSTNLNARFPTP